MPTDSSLTTFVGLLRGINVGGGNRISMTELRALCQEFGWSGVQTYIQSGNLVFAAGATRTAVEDQIEAGIREHLGLSIPVIARTAAEWSTLVESNPFPGPTATEPNLVMLVLAKAEPIGEAVDRLKERAVAGEEIARRGDALWIHYPAGAGTSKLSPGLLDRVVGSAVTTRNWRTVMKLHEMTGAAGS